MTARGSLTPVPWRPSVHTAQRKRFVVIYYCCYNRVVARARLHGPSPLPNGERARSQTVKSKLPIATWNLQLRLAMTRKSPPLPVCRLRARPGIILGTLHGHDMDLATAMSSGQSVQVAVALCGSMWFRERALRCSRPLERRRGPTKRPGDWQKRKCLASRLLQISPPIRGGHDCPSGMRCVAAIRAERERARGPDRRDKQNPRQV